MSTIDDVAKRAGVSKSSVSRVLNGNFEYMSAGMREKIEKAIEELNYKPNSVAQSLKKKETRIIGLVLADLNAFWSEAMKGVQEECSRHGYGLMISVSSWDVEKDLENIHMMKSKQVDGLIVSVIGQQPAYEMLKSLNIPFVFADSSIDDFEADKVMSDSVAGAKQAMEYLIGLGHRRIATMLFPLENAVRRDRLDGYKQALLEHGIPVDESLIKICKAGKGTNVDAAVELMKMPDRPSAIFTTNMHLTLDALKAARIAGLSIPNDISIVGYDDSEWAPLLDPPLTTVAVSAQQIGREAAGLLIQKMQGKSKGKQRKLEILPKLVVRQSAAPTAIPATSRIEA